MRDTALAWGLAHKNTQEIHFISIILCHFIGMCYAGVHSEYAWYAWSVDLADITYHFFKKTRAALHHPVSQ